ncbi:ABC transporter ATP-binding protein [Quadrisphaera setariae]|uniref:ABC transporter ATP-binding protein n=1 Tax=Quadrisphaera setariae TaxID=2593304 RepID=A0A5C8ZHJ5_9ACTN|nr:ABC transporter ATP-binding protein [Quadrisphaera setariae]TXR57525.1 ABC transporter ATP-binding protein [Quadrisphaera setariae]
MLPPRGDAAAALVVRGLVKRYGRRTALDGLDLEARRGEVTAVLGPNGAGKTTLVECCTGLRRPDGGSLSVLGLDPRADGRPLAARTGVLLQDGGLPGGAPAEAVLRLVAAQHSDPMDVPELARLLGVDGFGRTNVRRLSGGQKQRLALACAVVGRPELAFLDEPSTGLDPHARAVVWDLLEQLRAAGTAVLLTTHSMAEAERLADAVVVVRDGRAVASGTVEELTSSGPEVLRFGAPAGLPLDALRAALPTSVATDEAEPGRYEVTALRPGAVDPQVVATAASWCAAQGVLPQGLAVGRRSLEDVVLELTGGPSRWAA